MAQTQISKIQFRRGPAFDLPGIPTNNPTIPNAGLDPGEFGFTTDQGRLFIGIDPTQHTSTNTRTDFPFTNIEILTENSTDVLQKKLDAHWMQMTDCYNYVPLPITTTMLPLRLLGGALVGSQTQLATYTYFLFTVNTSATVPIRVGTLSLSNLNSSAQLVDNYIGDPGDGIQFSASMITIAGITTLSLMYLNSSISNLFMKLRSETPII